MKDLLNELKETKLIRITGSYACGKETENSDIDIYIKPDKPDTDLQDRNIEKIKVVLKKHNIKWGSTIMGYIYTKNTEIQLEFSDLFNKRKDRLKSVNIFGLEFKTH